MMAAALLERLLEGSTVVCGLTTSTRDGKCEGHKKKKRAKRRQAEAVYFKSARSQGGQTISIAMTNSAIAYAHDKPLMPSPSCSLRDGILGVSIVGISASVAAVVRAFD